MILLLKIAKRNGGRKIARKLRDWYPGAIYHIMHRGVRRKPIFEDEMDHQVLLQIIKTSLSKYNCWLHAYCLMTNHVHLLLETGDIVGNIGVRPVRPVKGTSPSRRKSCTKRE